MDAQVRQLKLEHLKRRAADALLRRNFRDACDGFTEALQLCPVADRAARRALLANRSAALLGAGRAADALRDARDAAAAAPGWAKARWREGRALGALGRWPEACRAYARAWDLSGGDPECAAALRSAAARLTRPQLADSLLSLLLPGSFGGDGADDVSAGAGQVAGSCGELLGWEHGWLGNAQGDGVGGTGAAAALPHLPTSTVAGAAAAPLPLPPAGCPGGAGALVALEASNGHAARGPEAASHALVDAAVEPAALETAGSCGGGAAVAGVVLDSEGRRLEGDAAGLRREAVREAMFLEVKEEGPAAAQARLCRWLLRPGRGPPPHEAALARAALAARLGLWRAARREAGAGLTQLAGLREADEKLLCRWLVGAHSLLGDAWMEGRFESEESSAEGYSGGEGGGVRGRGGAAVPQRDAAAAGRAYTTALGFLPVPAPRGAGGDAPARGVADRSAAAGGAGGEGGAAFAAWCDAQRRRLAARLATARAAAGAAGAAGGPLGARDTESFGGGGGAGAPEAAVLLSFSWPARGQSGSGRGGPELAGTAAPAAPRGPLTGGERASLLPALAAAASAAAAAAEGPAAAAPRTLVEVERVAAPCGGRGLLFEVKVSFPGERGASRAGAFAAGAAASLSALAAACEACGSNTSDPSAGDGHGGGAAAELLREWAMQGCSLAAEVWSQQPGGPPGGGDGLGGADRTAAQAAAAGTGGEGRAGPGGDGASGGARAEPGAQVPAGPFPPAAPGMADSTATAAPAAAAAATPAASSQLAPANTQLAGPAPPLPAQLPLALPYASYRLVTSSGAPAERPDKHPFCMSRVHYAAPPGGGGGGGAVVWFEPAEGGCRWRQTASGVEIICTRVPPQLPAGRLEVAFEPYRLRVTDRVTREVYLEGALERGVVTSECVWTHGGGEGEEGCLLTLAKMNLELFERPWRHSECWWPRLFAGEAAVIAWDDADKDYSDLPHEIEALRLREEALEEAQRHVAAGDKRTRARLQDQEEGRRRRRHERLAALKSACWRAAAAAAAAPSVAAAAPAAAGLA